MFESVVKSCLVQVQANTVYQSSNPGSLYPGGDYIHNYGQDEEEDGNTSDSEGGGGRRRW